MQPQIDMFIAQEQRQKRREGYTCNCCGLYVKEYRRKFNSNMALALVCLYIAGRDAGNQAKYFHLEELIRARGLKRCGDFPYLVHYGFIKKLDEKRDDDSDRNGFYQITRRGWLFARKEIATEEYFTVFNGACTGKEGRMITISQALGNKFSYAELMQ